MSGVNVTGVRWLDHDLRMREILLTLTYAKHNVPLPSPKYVIAWEDPDEIDAPTQFTSPSRAWLGMAMHGKILPPVEVYHALAHDEAQPDFERHHRGHILHTAEPVDAMTEREAMEYLVKMHLPPRVWRDYRGNRDILRIVTRASLPADMTHRDAWQFQEQRIAA
jgi:hypothetical protein